MQKNELKQILLSTQNYIDNEFCDKYLDLILNNIFTEKEKYATQAHHFIPVHCYFKDVDATASGSERRNMAEIEANKDNQNFLINLKFKDHVLAHYYLGRCALDSKTFSADMTAVQYTLGNSTYKQLSQYPDEKQLLLSLDNLQELYSLSKKEYWNSLSDTVKSEISSKHSEIQKNVAKTFTDEFISDMNEKRKNTWDSHTDEQKSEYSVRKSAEVSEIWKNRTESEREAIKEKISNTKQTMSEEAKQIARDKWIATHNSRTDEEKRIQHERAVAASEASKEKRTSAIKEAMAKRTPEQRSLTIKKSWETRRKNGNTSSKVPKVQCEFCGIMISKNTYQAHKNRHINKPESFIDTKYKVNHEGLACEFCGRVCKNHSGLTNHERICKVKLDYNNLKDSKSE